MTYFLYILLLLPAAATAADLRGPRDAHTPTQQTCPAGRWLEEELSRFQIPELSPDDHRTTVTEGPAETAARPPTEAAEGAAAARATETAVAEKQGNFVELTASALKLALENQPYVKPQLPSGVPQYP